MSEWRRRTILAALGASASGTALALGGNNEKGTLSGGTMALSEAYNVSGDLWIGPDSAKSNVDANSGRVYMASDTQVEYYGDNGSWTKLGLGSSSEAVPELYTQSVNRNGADVAVDQDLDLQSSQEVKNASAVITDDVDTKTLNGSNWKIYKDGTTYKARTPKGAGYYEDTTPDVHALINTIIENEQEILTLQLVGGEYTYHTTLNPSNKSLNQIRITGDGLGPTEVKAADGINTDAIQLGPDSQDMPWFSMDWIKYIGNKSNNTSGTGLVTDRTGGGAPRDAHFDHMFFSKYPDSGIISDTWHGWRITNSLVEHCGSDAIVIDAGEATPDQFHIDNCFIADNGGWGITVQNPTNNIVNAYLRLVAKDNDDGGVHMGASQWKYNRADLICRQNGPGGTSNGFELGDGSTQNMINLITHGNTDYGFDIVGSPTPTKNIINAMGNGNTNGLHPTPPSGWGASRNDNLVNGVGWANARPSMAGKFEGESDWVAQMDATVYDTTESPETAWKASDSGDWFPLSPISDSYTGDGTTGRDIELGFEPDWVLVQGSDGTTYDIWNGLGKGILGTSPNGELSISTSNTGGITVGDNSSDADPNTDAESYTVLAG